MAQMFQGTPVPVSSKPLATTGVSSVVGIGPTGNVVLSRKSSIDIREFGDTTAADVTSVFNAAYAEASKAGYSQIVIPQGTYYAHGIAPKSNVALVAPNGATIRIHPDDSTHNAIIRNLTDSLENLLFEGITFGGNWQSYQSLLSDNGLVTLKYVDHVLFDKCGFTNSRNFGVHINESKSATVRNCDLKYISRDGIAIWGTPRVLVTCNRIDGNDDDAVSINYETTGAAPLRSQIIVSHNILRDCGAIRTEAPHEIIIEGNVGDRQTGTGILVGINNATGVNVSSGSNVKVLNNIITNVIDRQWKPTGEQVGSSDSRIGIMIRSIAPQAGSYAVVPGIVNPATGIAPNPYSGFYDLATVGGAGAIRVPSGIEVSGNTVGRTLPGVASYSDWGYGQSFTESGMRDTGVPSSLLAGKGIRVELPQDGIDIRDNRVSGHKYGISLKLDGAVSAADRLLTRSRICQNFISDFEFAGVNWELGTLTYQDVLIADNSFDGDIYFTHANRGSNGTWATSDFPIALNLPYLAGARVERNSIKNVSQALSATSVTTLQTIHDNLLVCDPAASGFSTSNKGIGNIAAIGTGGRWWIEGRDCDPTSANFDRSLGENVRNSSGVPTSGKWLTGMVVDARGLDTQTGQTIHSYYRATTGTGNVDGTDWITLYVSGKARLRGTATYDPPSIAAGAWGASTTVTVTGAAVGDPVEGIIHSTGAALLWSGTVTAANTATVAPFNPTGSAVDAGSGSIVVWVRKN